MQPTSNLNVTPMIDVLLVLLVIFMSALPLSQRRLDTILPPESAPATATAIIEHVVVKYSADRRIAINKQPISIDGLEPP